MRFPLILIGTLILVGTGCASQAELAAREQNAFDISGNYTPTAASSLPLTLTIVNLAARSDVQVSGFRDAMSDQEKTFFQQQGLDASTVESLFKAGSSASIVLGSGSTSGLDGGDNYSDDFGATDTLLVTTPEKDYDANHRVFYQLSGTIKKTETILRGYLTAIVQVKKTDVDSTGAATTSWSEVARLNIGYEAKSDKAAYAQYLGNWSGSVMLAIGAATGDTLGQMSGTSLMQKDAAFFTATPHLASVQVAGRVYTFANQDLELKTLSDSSYPDLELRFIAGDGSRLVFFGTIFSLGNYSGTVVEIAGSSETILGSFVFVRN